MQRLSEMEKNLQETQDSNARELTTIEQQIEHARVSGNRELAKLYLGRRAICLASIRNGTKRMMILNRQLGSIQESFENARMVKMLLSFKDLKAPNQKEVDDALDVLKELEDDNLDFIAASEDPLLDLDAEVDALFDEGSKRDLLCAPKIELNTSKDIAVGKPEEETPIAIGLDDIF